MRCISTSLQIYSYTLIKMVEISNSDIERILNCLDIAIAHYKSLKGLRNSNHAWAIGLLKDKINRKLSKQQLKSQNL